MALNNAVNATNQGVQCLNTTTGVWNGRTITAGTGISIINGDGVSGNPTITNIGGVPDPFSTLYLVDDFIFADQAFTTVGDTNWVQSGGISHTGVTDHPGYFRLGQSGSIGYIYKGFGSFSNGAFVLGSGVLTIEYCVRITAANAATYIVGLGKGTLGSEPTDGVYFYYKSDVNSGKWVGKTANASTYSSANSANTVVANQWDRLKIIVNAAATSVSFFVNGTEITNSPLATNIPTANIMPYVSRGSEAVAGSIDVDLCVITYALTTPR